jgi:hypothetical protein
MSDVLLVVITIAFFGVAVLLVRACDAIIGPDEEDLLDGPERLAEAGSPTDDGGNGVGAGDAADGEPVLTGVAS